MNNPTWTGVLPAGNADFTPASPIGAARRAMRRTWGVICGVSFIATRASIYVLVGLFTAIVCVAGVALYTAQALAGGHARGERSGAAGPASSSSRPTPSPASTP